MLSLPPSVRVFFYRDPADMRRSFDGLAALAGQIAQNDPLSGHLFVFRNRRGDRVKILYWDRDGYAIWYKRLEEGAFAFPEGDGVAAVLNSTDLMLILGGIDLSGARRKKRYVAAACASF